MGRGLQLNPAIGWILLPYRRAWRGIVFAAVWIGATRSTSDVCWAFSACKLACCRPLSEKATRQKRCRHGYTAFGIIPPLRSPTTTVLRDVSTLNHDFSGGSEKSTGRPNLLFSRHHSPSLRPRFTVFLLLGCHLDCP